MMTGFGFDFRLGVAFEVEFRGRMYTGYSHGQTRVRGKVSVGATKDEGHG